MILLYKGLKEEKRNEQQMKNALRLEGEHIRYVSARTLKEMMQTHADQLQDALLINYGHGNMELYDQDFYKEVSEFF